LSNAWQAARPAGPVPIDEMSAANSLLWPTTKHPLGQDRLDKRVGPITPSRNGKLANYRHA
jgi:hypothetical protein